MNIIFPRYGIDKNEEAIEISRKLIKILGLEHLVTVQKCEAQMVQDCKEFNLVCIAGMVGKDTVEKTKIINYLSKKVLPGTIFLIRSAEGLRQLLYAPVDIHNIPLIDFCIKIVPMDIIENSLLVGKKIEKMIKQ